jgi:hypothetical protein
MWYGCYLQTLGWFLAPEPTVIPLYQLLQGGKGQETFPVCPHCMSKRFKYLLFMESFYFDTLVCLDLYLSINL